MTADALDPRTASRALASLPGPPQWPVVGNLLQVDHRCMHASLERWADEYGPAYRANFGRNDVLVLSDSEAIGAMLRDRPDGWRRLSSSQRVIREMGGHGLFSAEGDDWRRQRRLVMSAFDPGHLHRYFPSLVRVTERFRAKLDAAARDGSAIDLQAMLMRYTVDVTAGLAFGIDMNTQEQPGDALQAHLDKVFPMMMRRIFAPVAWWRYVRLPSDRRFDAHLAKVHAAVEGFIAEARARLDADPARRERPENLLEALLVARDEAGDALDEAEIVGNVMTVLLAGEDTTANTLSWALYLLHRHRDAWDAMVADVDAALSDGVAGDDIPRTFDTARGLDAIERCVSEAMRLRPVAPFMLFQNNAATAIAGVTLPENTTVITLMRHDSVDARRVHDASGFDPDRWRMPRSDDAGASQRAALKASMPFGAGPRLCPGRYLAMLEMKMVLATIARNFELVDVATEDGTPPMERLAFTMAPLGLRMRVARRG